MNDAGVLGSRYNNILKKSFFISTKRYVWLQLLNTREFICIYKKKRDVRSIVQTVQCKRMVRNSPQSILIRRNNDEKIPLITLKYDLRYILYSSFVFFFLYITRRRATLIEYLSKRFLKTKLPRWFKCLMILRYYIIIWTSWNSISQIIMLYIGIRLHAVQMNNINDALNAYS